MLFGLLLMILATAAPAPTVAYAALGDSTGVGVGAGNDGGYVRRIAERIGRAGRTVRLDNRCVPGARLADVLRTQVDGSLARHPQLVTVGIGINDVTLATPIEVFEKLYDELLDRLAASGARVVLLDVPDLSLSPLAQGDTARVSILGRVRAVNAAISAAAARHGIPVASVFAQSQAELPHHPELFSGDGFHPSAKGYDRWAEVVWPAVAGTLGLQAEAFSSRPARQ